MRWIKQWEKWIPIPNLKKTFPLCQICPSSCRKTTIVVGDLRYMQKTKQLMNEKCGLDAPPLQHDRDAQAGIRVLSACMTSYCTKISLNLATVGLCPPVIIAQKLWCQWLSPRWWCNDLALRSGKPRWSKTLRAVDRAIVTSSVWGCGGVGAPIKMKSSRW